MRHQDAGINKKMLLDRINSSKKSVSEVAESIGIDPSTFYRKLNNNGIKFTIGEMHAIVKTLKLSNKDACNIFLI